MSSISIENLTVRFLVYHNVSPSLKEWFVGLFRREKSSGYSNFIALDNISLAINSGERVGVVGHNGAGKSTLLKSICRIYHPEKGTITVDGGVAPLLEIGAGFHPEFTGRENIHLNGAILGKTKRQLKALESGVIEFAELEEFIDTPVKYYSTGMYMRLAFSVATGIHPDILVLDEIFAGGDADFTVKAKARMLEVIDSANILVMVSHDHELIKAVCNRVVWLDHGKIIADGDPVTVVDRYLKRAYR